MINNREDANKYYQLVNELVDDYIDKWKIRPSSLKRYLKPGGDRFNKFLERNKLKDVKGADKVLRDVIEDRHHMETDGVITFESFKFFESDEFKIKSLSQCLYKGIEKADTAMEKALADYFDSSLGQIDIVDAGKHMFKVNNWENNNIDVVIYSEEELETIKYSIFENLYEDLCSKKIELTKDVSITLGKVIYQGIFENKMFNIFTPEILVKTITNCLGEYDYKGQIRNYKIWIKR